MISGYTDHAANERTYLAWLRTGIAVIAFGVVIERFNLFLTIASAAFGEGMHRSQLTQLPGGLGRYDGLALILGGVALVVLATVRFVRTTRLLNDVQMHRVTDTRTELTLLACLLLIITSFSVYLAFG